MIRISEVLVVEGKYDKIKLSQLFDTLILTTDGFRIYKNKEKLQLLRRIAAERGVIVLTDSDSAGFRIRNYIRQCLGSVPVKHVYVPAVAGRERRKKQAGAEGLLGVEGLDDRTLTDAVLAQAVQASASENPVTTAELYEWGLLGGPNSAALRAQLARAAQLPPHLSSGALLSVLNTLYTRPQLEELIQKLK